MLVSKIKGLKYPDEYFTKFFYKNGLHKKKKLKFLEFGCGNGNNLMLPYQYDHEVIGVDYDHRLTQMANYNFKNIIENSDEFNFNNHNMKEFVQNRYNIFADVLMLPSVVYYINKNDFICFMDNLLKNNLIKNNIKLYIRVRSKKDFRYGYGVNITGSRCKLPNNSVTGENNSEIEFYSEHEIINLLEKHLKLRDFKIFSLDNQNDHSGKIILNSDIVIWGTIN